MNKDDLIGMLTASRAEMEDCLENVSDDQYLVPGVSGERSVKDLLAHLTIWEAQLITLIFRSGLGRKPDTAHFSKEPRRKLNERWQEQHKDRPIEKVLEDFEGIRNQTIRRLEELSDGDLTNPKRYPWLSGHPLWWWVMNDTVEHERHHMKEIKAWLDGSSVGG
jgi:hypothetical protein